MPLNLRCVAAQAWRSIVSRRNLSSWPRSNGGKHVTVPVSKRVVSYMNTVEIPTYLAYGLIIDGSVELYHATKVIDEDERLLNLDTQLANQRRLGSVYPPTKE